MFEQDPHKVKEEVTHLSEGRALWSQAQSYPKTQGRTDMESAVLAQSARDMEESGPTDTQDHLHRQATERPLRNPCQGEKR